MEIRGIDIRVHGEPAYPNAAYGHGWDNEGQFALDGKNEDTVTPQNKDHRVKGHLASDWVKVM